MPSFSAKASSSLKASSGTSSSTSSSAAAIRSSSSSSSSSSPSSSFSLFDVWLRQFASRVRALLSAICIYVASATGEGDSDNDDDDDDEGGDSTEGSEGGHGGGNEADDDGEEGSSTSSSSLVATALLLFGGVLLIPYFSLNFDMQSRFDAVLFQYTEGQASGIVYHRNLFEVVLKGPVLVLNWFVLAAMNEFHGNYNSGDDENDDGNALFPSFGGGGAVAVRRDDERDDEAAEDAAARAEQRTGAVVLAACVAVLLLTLAYFRLVDRPAAIGKHRSAAALVDRTGAALAEVSQSVSPVLFTLSLARSLVPSFRSFFL